MPTAARIYLPQMQPVPSIMPCQLNPVIPEAMNQTGLLVIGVDLALTLAASTEQLQRNVMAPVFTFTPFSSIMTMERAIFSRHW